MPSHTPSELFLKLKKESPSLPPNPPHYNTNLKTAGLAVGLAAGLAAGLVAGLAAGLAAGLVAGC